MNKNSPRCNLCHLSLLMLLVAGLFVTSCNAFQDDAAILHSLMDEVEEFEDRQDEEREDSGNDIMPVETIEDLNRRNEFWVDVKQRLDSLVVRDQLDLRDQITYDSFQRDITHTIKEHEYQDYLIPLNHEGGFYTRMNGLQNRVPLDSLEHYEDYLSRLRAIPDYFNEYIDRMRRGIEIGYTLPRVIFVDDYDHYVTTHIVLDPQESAFYEPFIDFPATISEPDQERLAEEGRTVISDIVMPTYQSFVDFLHQEYIPNSRETIGTRDLPNGEEYYSHLVEYHTTLPLSAEDVHRIGLEEVDRILEEMYGIIDEVDFEGDFQEFLEFLRTDPQFYVDEPRELLKEASFLAKRMDGFLPDIFHIEDLPRRPYGVEPVPDHLAPRYTGGRYAGGRYFWVNTYALESRPLYTLEALAYHEAVPGHHLQIGLNREMEDLPRRSGGVTAFSEGWALYAERLGLDVGLYENPYYDFGRLTYEMWRACRLVVDTGMHALGWTRQEAVDFLTQHTALSHHEIDTEINRYIAVPGQALAYKMGELKIRELRELAEEELGDDFDIRDFHSSVLQNGPVTLPVLEQQVLVYINEAKESAE